MSNFALPDSYASLEVMPPQKAFPKGEFTLDLADVKSYFPTVTVPVGTVLYRADRAGPKAPSKNMPAFFGNKKSVGVYGAKKEENITRYRTTKPITLLELNMNSTYLLQKALIAHMPDGFISEDQMELVAVWCDMDSGVVRPTVPIGPKDASGHIPYLNRFMADLVCKMGFDGWIAFPFSPEKRQGLLQMSIIHGVVPYSPEIMMCKWGEFMEPVAAGGKRRRTLRKRYSSKK